MTQKRHVTEATHDRNHVRAIVLICLPGLIARAESARAVDFVREGPLEFGLCPAGDRDAAGLEPREPWQGEWTVERS